VNDKQPQVSKTRANEMSDNKLILNFRKALTNYTVLGLIALFCVLLYAIFEMEGFSNSNSKATIRAFCISFTTPVIIFLVIAFLNKIIGMNIKDLFKDGKDFSKLIDKIEKIESSLKSTNSSFHVACDDSYSQSKIHNSLFKLLKNKFGVYIFAAIPLSEEKSEYINIVHSIFYERKNLMALAIQTDEYISKIRQNAINNKKECDQIKQFEESLYKETIEVRSSVDENEKLLGHWLLHFGESLPKKPILFEVEYIDPSSKPRLRWKDANNDSKIYNMEIPKCSDKYDVDYATDFKADIMAGENQKILEEFNDCLKLTSKHFEKEFPYLGDSINKSIHIPILGEGSPQINILICCRDKKEISKANADLLYSYAVEFWRIFSKNYSPYLK